MLCTRSLLSLFVGSALVVSAQSQIQAVVNAASFQSGLPAGGRLATLFLTDVTTPPGTYVAPPDQPLPLSLAGISVNVNYDAAPILAVVVPPNGASGITQVNFQVPMERNVSLALGTNGQPEFPGNFTVSGTGVVGVPTISVPAEPYWGGFFSNGNGYAVALHASSSSLITTQSPAQPGETVIVYADDFIGVWPPPPIAIPLPQGVVTQFQQGERDAGPSNLYLQTSITAGSFCQLPPPVQVSFLGLAQGMVGVEEIDFVVPPDQPAGNWQLYFANMSPGGTGGGCTSSTSPSVLLPVGQ